MNKENVRVTATPRLLELLASINHAIAYQLIEMVKYRHQLPLSFMDFGETNDSISYIQANKVYEMMSSIGDAYKQEAWKSKRTSMKVGKLVKMIFGNSFPINQPKGVAAPKPPVDIESFVNMFKAEKDKNKNYERFEIVSGKDIKFWYNQANYSRFIQEDTTLAKSCLRYEESGKLLEMYVRNPELVRMLILKDDVNRLRGRALLWNLTEPNDRLYLERIYTINDCDVELYKNYARKEGWLYKSRQTFGYNWNIIDGRDGNEYPWSKFPMRVQLKVKPRTYYPYLDTLSVYNPDTGMLSNEGQLLRRPPYIKLSDAQGSFVDEAEHRDMVHSQFYGEDIPRDGAQHVNLDNDWVFEDDVVYVHNSGERYSHKRSRLICESNILGKVKYFIKTECIFSEYLNTNIFKESVREAFLDKDKKEKVLIHKRLVSKFFDVNPKTGDIIKKKEETDLDKYLTKLKEIKSRSSFMDGYVGRSGQDTISMDDILRSRVRITSTPRTETSPDISDISDISPIPTSGSATTTDQGNPNSRYRPSGWGESLRDNRHINMYGQIAETPIAVSTPSPENEVFDVDTAIDELFGEHADFQSPILQRRTRRRPPRATEIPTPTVTENPASVVTEIPAPTVVITETPNVVVSPQNVENINHNLLVGGYNYNSYNNTTSNWLEQMTGSLSYDQYMFRMSGRTPSNRWDAVLPTPPPEPEPPVDNGDDNEAW